jgi:DNA-binding CsgD family transcriptional regulator/pimeloyl-ACP methyl ester carboxylesterase
LFVETPVVRYAQTSDGLSVGYCASGEGPPIIQTPNAIYGSLDIERMLPSRQAWNARLGGHFRLLRYDHRGTGFSTREVPDVGLESRLLDLEAVWRAGAREPCGLLGWLDGGVDALEFARRWPQRVRALVLWPSDTPKMPADELVALRKIAETDWDQYCEIFGGLANGWGPDDEAHLIAVALRHALTQEHYLKSAYLFSWRRAMSIAPMVQVPTLIVHREPQNRGDQFKALAVALPQSRHVVLPGTNRTPSRGDAQNATETIVAFFREHLLFEDGGRADGSRPLDHRIEALTELTEREREVLRLLAAGLTSRQMAERLVLSVRTVERHISSVYSKLGVHSRSQVMALLMGGSEAGPRSN